MRYNITESLCLFFLYFIRWLWVLQETITGWVIISTRWSAYGFSQVIRQKRCLLIIREELMSISLMCFSFLWKELFKVSIIDEMVSWIWNNLGIFILCAFELFLIEHTNEKLSENKMNTMINYSKCVIFASPVSFVRTLCFVLNRRFMKMKKYNFQFGGKKYTNHSLTQSWRF